jgi:hypothetical protein
MVKGLNPIPRLKSWDSNRAKPVTVGIAATADCAGEFTDTQKEMQKLAEMGETLLFMDWFKLL